MKTKLILLTLLWGVFSFANSAYAITINKAFLTSGEELTILDTTNGQMFFTKEEAAHINNLTKHTVIVIERVYTDTGIDYYRGSGIAIDKRHILTAFHVIDSDQKHDSYYFSSKGSNPFTTNVVKQDPLHDLALLEIDKNAPDLIAEPLPFAKDITLNEPIYTVGHPKGKLYQFTTGKISWLTGKGSDSIESIQLDMRIQSGNSGGFTINQQGDIVGMMFSASPVARNMAFMIGKDEIQNFLKGV